MKAVFVLLAVTVAVYANPKHTERDEELFKLGAKFESLKNEIRSLEDSSKTRPMATVQSRNKAHGDSVKHVTSLSFESLKNVEDSSKTRPMATVQSRNKAHGDSVKHVTSLSFDSLKNVEAPKAADTEENDDVDDLLGSLHVHDHKPLVQIEGKLRELKKIKASKGYKAKQNSPCAFAGWKRVRHVPASYGKWHPSTDQLKGTSVYGSEGDDSQPWSVHFAYDNFEEFGFATGDCEHWLVAKKSQVFSTNWRDSFDCKIEKSSWEHKQYGAKWFNRPGVHQDPYVSIRGYGVDSGRTHMYIGNNNNGGSNEFFMPREHDGADVYIR